MRWQKNTCKFVCKSFEKKKVDVGRISTREDFFYVVEVKVALRRGGKLFVPLSSEARTDFV